VTLTSVAACSGGKLAADEVCAISKALEKEAATTPHKMLRVKNLI
jgi:hypothetical protein